MTSYDLIWLLIQEILKNTSSDNSKTEMRNSACNLFRRVVSSATLFFEKKRYVPSNTYRLSYASYDQRCHSSL